MAKATLEEAVTFLRTRVSHAPEVALVLGSGLGGLADRISDAAESWYAEVPGMGTSSVAGHRGRFVAGRLENRQVIAMQGRLHPYEGHALSSVVMGVRAMIALGAKTLVVTNAAGGLDANMPPGSLMLIEDHINLSGLNCLAGPNDPALGPRFPDMTNAYDPELRGLASSVAKDLGLTLERGVYAGVLGPSYETPAEVRMLGVLGARAVGMSTVQEVIAARHMGARVLGLSCVTNLAAGLSPEPLRHEDVEARARASAEALSTLVCGVLARLDEVLCKS